MSLYAVWMLLSILFAYAQPPDTLPVSVERGATLEDENEEDAGNVPEDQTSEDQAAEDEIQRFFEHKRTGYSLGGGLWLLSLSGTQMESIPALILQRRKQRLFRGVLGIE